MTRITVELEPGLPSQGGMGCFIRDTLIHAGLGDRVLQVSVVFPQYGAGSNRTTPNLHARVFSVEVREEGADACLAALRGPAFKRVFVAPERHRLESSGKIPEKTSETPAEDLMPDPTPAP